MPRILPTAAGLALLVAPLEAQVGLSSAARTVVLTATKHGAVGVLLPGGLDLRASGGAPVPIETSWDLDPSQTPSVTLLAYLQTPAVAGARAAPLVLFAREVTDGAAAGDRTERLQVRLDRTGWADLPAGKYGGILNLLAITQ